ncbi:flagellin [Lysinibacillus boronitolerans]|uniref:Flagellin n=1 Tax=Lysinibacillus boronitolerans JCM 21713 = 10a = NBRC 103108 TaxID=1294264 RepID=A0ABR4Y1V4_9BACI|nr:flagellin [Lysinibacillus boronitolerans]KGR86934.1 flagellin [Lysinibacillus boronitolerans JCM 21713 = 10a = NBRC 103108]
MRIQHNISALNTHRNLGFNNTQASKNLEKLSSGFKINRAGDDAAGLAISEKMRGQIRGLDMATKNAQDSISLIQTAEGALNETHSILQRMRELAVQSSNDTNTAQDRAELQKEMDQLSQEITRISTDTEFNTRKLLNGDLSGSSNAVTFHIGANSSQNIKLEIAELDAEALDVAGLSGASTALTGIAGATVSNRTGEDLTIKYEAVDTNPSGKAVTQTTATMSNDGKTVTIKLAQEAGGTITASNQDVVDALKQLGSLSVKETGTITGSATVQADQTVNKATSVTEKTGIDISTQGAADKAISTIDKALSKVSNERSKLGAVQNRLEHTINNLGTSSENLTAAESRIRDTDMAAEMMAFTKNNILMQAAQSMLAQANQQPQGVLQLLG